MSIAILLTAAVLLLSGGIYLIRFASKRASPELKKSMIVTGLCLVGIPIFAVLHNLVYALFIHFFGEDFWGKGAGDEPFFFMLAIFVCPIGAIVGAIRMLVIKRRIKLGDKGK